MSNNIIENLGIGNSTNISLNAKNDRSLQQKLGISKESVNKSYQSFMNNIKNNIKTDTLNIANFRVHGHD